MTVEELLELSVATIGIEIIHPLHKAMLEECCENALANEQGITDKEILVQSVMIAFVTCNSMLKGTIKAGLEHGDIVNLNYRGLSFTIDKESPLIKN